jgi:hypothetical protein
MNRAVREEWACARTLAGLGELTAQWIEGKVGEQPGYCGPSDLDDPERLAPVCAALCRAGFMTTGSQAGESGPGFGRARWEQRAAVEGFADCMTAGRLRCLARRAGLLAITHSPALLPRWRIRYDRAVTVSRHDGQDCTWFGARLSRRHLASPVTGYGECGKDAVAAVCGAWQVAVIDPEWERPDLLWDVLAGICDRQEG